MATEDFKLLQKVHDLMIYSYPILDTFPKNVRFSFAQRIRDCMNTLLELTIEEQKRYIKKTTIQNMDIENEKLKRYIQIAFELRYIDKHRFFFRIPHEVQLRELGKPLDDPDMIWFLETCIKGDGRPTGLPLDCGDPTEAERIFGIGMPVGSLISQMTANVVMTPVDHFMKRVARVPLYARYMDDMIMMGESKQQMWDCLGMMDDFLQTQMGLQLNNKTAVMKYDEGVEFVGRIVTPDRIDMRKSSSLQMKRHLDYVKEAYGKGEVTLEYALDVITSYLGLLEHTDSKALREKICEDYVLIRHSAPEA